MLFNSYEFIFFYLPIVFFGFWGLAKYCHDYLHMFERSIEQLCQDKEVSFFNFSNLAWIDSNDNESIDGFHGSDLAYAKMIRVMLSDNIFCKYVDVDCLHKMIQNAVSNVLISP